MFEEKFAPGGIVYFVSPTHKVRKGVSKTIDCDNPTNDVAITLEDGIYLFEADAFRDVATLQIETEKRIKEQIRHYQQELQELEQVTFPLPMDEDY